MIARKSIAVQGEVKEMSFREVYEQFEPLVYKKARRWKSRRDLDDLLQEASIALWHAYQQYDYKKHKTQFMSLAFTTIKYHLLNYMRDTQSKSKLETAQVKYVDSLNDRISNMQDEQMELKDTIESGEDIESTVVTKVYIDDFLSLVTEQQRTILLLNASGYSIRDIAKKIGVNRGHVYYHARKAREIIKEEINA